MTEAVTTVMVGTITTITFLVLCLCLASLGVAAIVGLLFLAKFVRSESEKKVKEEEERVRRNANLPTSAMRPPRKNVVYVGQKARRGEKKTRDGECDEKREEEELKRRKAAMDAPAGEGGEIDDDNDVDDEG